MLVDVIKNSKMSKYYVGYLNIKRKYTCKTGKINWKKLE